VVTDATTETAGAVVTDVTAETAGAVVTAATAETAGVVVTAATAETAGVVVTAATAETAGVVVTAATAETAGALSFLPLAPTQCKVKSCRNYMGTVIKYSHVSCTLCSKIFRGFHTHFLVKSGMYLMQLIDS
jgi:hypothetical protein